MKIVSTMLSHKNVQFSFSFQIENNAERCSLLIKAFLRDICISNFSITKTTAALYNSNKEEQRTLLLSVRFCLPAAFFFSCFFLSPTLCKLFITGIISLSFSVSFLYISQCSCAPIFTLGKNHIFYQKARFLN